MFFRSHVVQNVPKSEEREDSADVFKLLVCAGVDAFKEIARASTHNILAAYGLEHSKAIRCSSFTRPVCCHLEQDKQQHEASPMPNSCGGCFDLFVRNVVGSIVREKVGHVQ